MSLNSSNPAQFNRLSSRFSHSATLLFRSLSPPHKHLNLLHTRTAWLRSPKTQKFLSVGASLAPEPATYGGWEELGHVEDSVEQGEPAQLRRMLVSMGTDDQKYVFMFLSGLVCALAISRVRVSSILVFPACVSVFVIGFSFGLVRGGILAEVSGSKKVRSKEEVVKIYVESSRKFIGFLDELDTRMNRLRSDLHRAIDCNRVRLSDLENYAKEIQMVHSSVMNVRNDIGASIASIGNCGGSSAEKEKPSKKRKEEGNFGSPWLESIWSLFKGESLGGLKPNKAKDNVREDNVGNVVKDNPLESAPRVALDVSSSPKRSDPSQSRGNKPDGDRRVRRYMENGSMNFDEVGRTTRGYADIDGLNYCRERLHSLNGQYMYLRARHSHQSHSRESHDTMLHFEDFDSNMRHMETEASFMKDQLLEKSERYYTFPERRERCEVETYKSEVRIENKRSNEDFLFGDHQPEFDGDLSSSSSRTISEDMEFNRCLTRANSLLKQAKELARGGQDEEHAETILYESAELLSRAMAMKPKSLLAMGQLGNTYLLHGELKLRISRNLRTLLSSNNTYFDRQGLRGSSNGYPSSSKDEIASVLVQVCEECEELLIEAGRKYRQALSIDANDVRALYNWGLALSFRAQLIADIGPEAAFDADKVFLAAIDKFDAMMSKGNAYAPDALFRWGVALQERSRLRPRSSRDKVKLLEQAKRLYEDALDMDSDHPRVREALSSCILELNYKRLL